MNEVKVLSMRASLICILVGIGAGCVSKSAYVKQKKRADDLDTQLADAVKKNDELTQKLDQTSSTAAELAKQKADQEHLMADLKDQVAAGQIQVTQLAGKLSINMVDKILFASGSARVKLSGQEVLKKVGAAIMNIQDKRVWVGGHTDNVPISPSLRNRFPSNWELSTARATAVVRFLQDVAGIPGDRLIASGFGDTQPVADNSTPEGRQQNRRIEILLIPAKDDFSMKQGAASAPPAGVPAAAPAGDASTAPAAAPASDASTAPASAPTTGP